MAKKNTELEEEIPEGEEELSDEELADEELADEELADEEAAEAEEIAEELEEPEEPEEKFDAVAHEAAKMTADVPVQVVAVMGKKTISMKELVGMKMGQVIDLVRPANEAVDLVAGGKLLAKGELVDIDGKLGVRIVKMMR